VTPEDEDRFSAARETVLAAMAALDVPSLAPATIHVPARLNALSANRYWQSRQNWIGPLSTSWERKLTIVARDIVGRIASSAAWQLEPRLDLVAELDQIDEQAHRLAARADTDDVVIHGRGALADRVAALFVYADELDRHARRAAADTDEADSVLLAGAARDELAAEHVRALTEELAVRRQITIAGSWPLSD
jgi:hypothetical protein